MAARTNAIKSVAVAVESAGFANVDSTVGIPSPAGLTFVPIAGLRRADIPQPGEPVINTNDDQVRDAFYGYNPEVATMWSGGQRVQRKSGSVSLTFNEVQTLGDALGLISTYGGLPVHMMLHSGLALYTPPATGDTVAAGVGANAFTSTGVAGLYGIGALFGVTLNGRAEYSAVTDRGNPIVPDQIDHSPALSAPLTNEAIRFLSTLYPSPTLDALSSVALRFDGINWRTYCFGCRFTSARFNVSNDRVQLTIDLSFAYAADDNASAAQEEGHIPSGAAMHLRGSYVVIGDAAVPAQGSAAPYAIGREVVQPMTDSWTIEIANTYEREGHSDDITGMSDWTLITSSLTVSGTISVPTSTLDRDQLDRVYRSLLVGFAPQGEGNGMALYVPAAFLTVSGFSRDTSGDTVTFAGSWSPGPWRGDVSDSAVTTDPANAPWRLGFGL